MGKRTKPDSVLVNLAESIGSTLGTLAAKADAAQRALTKRDIADVGSSVQREGTKIVRSARKAVAGAKKKAARTVAATKRRATTARGRKRRGLRKGKSAGVAQRRAPTRAKPGRRVKKANRNPR